MSFKPVKQLQINRLLSTGQRVGVGTLVQNRQGVYFQYQADYLQQYGNLSPYTLMPDTSLQLAPAGPHAGLHGVFADSLPDGWGLLLQDRLFRQQGLLPAQLTAMDRLAFVGHSATGALQFDPVSDLARSADQAIDLATLGLAAQALFDGQSSEVLAALAAAGSSGGARPKAQIFLPQGQSTHIKTSAGSGDEAWLVKFTSQNLPLGHEEGLCEAAYLTLAQRAALMPASWQLLAAPAKSGAAYWLAVKRFDWLHQQPLAGRYHMLSACALLDADFRLPSLDYEQLIKASRQLCKSPAVGQLQFRRALFNLFALNQDDHSKNWAFLQDDAGNWQPAPFYDVTFSPHPFAEHMTAFAGHGKNPPLKAIQQLAGKAGYSDWQQARQAIEHIVDSLAGFGDIALELGVSPTTVKLIAQHHTAVRQQNKVLFEPN